MKFSGSVEIAKSRSEVVGYFKDPSYLGEYQDGFVKKELVSGESGEKGAISKMYYKYGKRDMELTETITANRLPDSFEAFYHHKHMDNTMSNHFSALDKQRTLYEARIEYLEFKSFMPKLMSFIMPGMFKKQTQKWLDQFKLFAESQV